MNTRKQVPMPRTSVAHKLLLLTMLCAVVGLLMAKCHMEEERNKKANIIPAYYYSLTFSTDWRETAIQ